MIELGHEDSTIRLCYGLRMEERISKTTEASWQSHVGSAVCLLQRSSPLVLTSLDLTSGPNYGASPAHFHANRAIRRSQV